MADGETTRAMESQYQATIPTGQCQGPIITFSANDVVSGTNGKRIKQLVPEEWSCSIDSIALKTSASLEINVLPGLLFFKDDQVCRVFTKNARLLVEVSADTDYRIDVSDTLADTLAAAGLEEAAAKAVLAAIENARVGEDKTLREKLAAYQSCIKAATDGQLSNSTMTALAAHAVKFNFQLFGSIQTATDLLMGRSGLTLTGERLAGCDETDTVSATMKVVASAPQAAQEEGEAADAKDDDDDSSSSDSDDDKASGEAEAATEDNDNDNSAEAAALADATAGDEEGSGDDDDE